jgi:FtsP/CotA-like multicopper oxidase with cupredoxin domain
VAGDITVVDATSANAGGPGSSLANPLEIKASEFQAQILPTQANWDGMPATCVDEMRGSPKKPKPSSASWAWGYLINDLEDKGQIRPSYLGPVVVAEKGVPFYPLYSNKLPPFGYVQMNFPIDMTLDWANPDGIDCQPDANHEWQNPICGTLPYIGDIPIASHLHGGEVAAAFDGGPDAWFTPNWKKTGAGWPGKVYEYPNDQQESTIWFHDHALGITRLNVYSGLAGAYPIIDPANPPQQAMPAFPAYDIPLILQDRSFDTNCELFYNLASNPQPNPSVHPFWIPEFIGDTNVVNGKTWPFLSVEPRQYRFRFINGANSRFYNLSLKNVADETPYPFIVIATDDGYLENAVSTAEVTIGPGERYEVIVDFGGMAAGTQILMMNDAAIPFPDGDPVIAGLTDEVMKFIVDLPLSAAPDTTIADGQPIRPATNPLHRIKDAFDSDANSITRQLTLNEAEGPGGPLELQVNNSKFNTVGILPGSPLTPLNRETELPAVGDTEVWEIINISADAHPMHTHLTSFQVLERIPFYYGAQSVNNYDAYVTEYMNQRASNGVGDGEGPPNQYNQLNADGAIGGNPAVNAYLNMAAARPVLDYEDSWKDVVIAYPGEVTRIVVRWAETDEPATGTGAPGPGDNTYPFDPTALVNGVGYVWHCHIIDHEDNEMMRNYVVGTARQPVEPFNP